MALPHGRVQAHVRVAQVIDGHGRQITDLLLGDIEPDTDIDPSHRTDRDSNLLPAPQVPLLKQHVSHVVVPGVDDKPFHQPDLAVGGMDAIAVAHLNLAQRHRVVGDGPHGMPPAGTSAAVQARVIPGDQAVVPPAQHLFRAVPHESRLPAGWPEMHLLGRIELLELRLGAVQPDRARRSVDKINRNKPPLPMLMLGFDHQMGKRPGDRVNDHTAQLAAGSIGTARIVPDRERRRLFHSRPPRSLTFIARSPAMRPGRLSLPSACAADTP